MTIPQATMIEGTVEEKSENALQKIEQWLDELHLDGLTSFKQIFLKASSAVDSSY